MRGSRRGRLAGAGGNARVADGAGDAVRPIGIRLSALAQDGLAVTPRRVSASSACRAAGSQAVLAGSGRAARSRRHRPSAR